MKIVMYVYVYLCMPDKMMFFTLLYLPACAHNKSLSFIFLSLFFQGVSVGFGGGGEFPHQPRKQDETESFKNNTVKELGNGYKVKEGLAIPILVPSSSSSRS